MIHSNKHGRGREVERGREGLDSNEWLGKENEEKRERERFDAGIESKTLL